MFALCVKRHELHELLLHGFLRFHRTQVLQISDKAHLLVLSWAMNRPFNPSDQSELRTDENRAPRVKKDLNYVVISYIVVFYLDAKEVRPLQGSVCVWYILDIGVFFVCVLPQDDLSGAAVFSVRPQRAAPTPHLQSQKRLDVLPPSALQDVPCKSFCLTHTHTRWYSCPYEDIP